MMSSRQKILWIFVILLLAIPSTQISAKSKKKSSFPLLQEKTINTIIDITARSVARRYDLTPQQAQIAREMIERNSWNFINEHYDELLETMPKLYEFRSRALSGNDPSPKEVQKVAEKLYPLIIEAQNLILSENGKFTQYLDEKQRLKHQKDIERMKKDFARMKRKFKRWKEGKYRPGEFSKRARRRRHIRNRQKTEEEKTLDPTEFDFWELYVKTFIEAYQLDEGQITLAYSVLNDIKAKATAYRHDHAREFQEIKQGIAKLSSANTTQPTEQRKKQLAEYQKKLDALNKPLLDMFEELKIRLMDIPTEAQKQAARQLLSTKPNNQGKRPELKK